MYSIVHSIWFIGTFTYVYTIAEYIYLSCIHTTWNSVFGGTTYIHTYIHIFIIQIKRNLELGGTLNSELGGTNLGGTWRNLELGGTWNLAELGGTWNLAELGTWRNLELGGTWIRVSRIVYYMQPKLINYICWRKYAVFYIYLALVIKALSTRETYL